MDWYANCYWRDRPDAVDSDTFMMKCVCLQGHSLCHKLIIHKQVVIKMARNFIYQRQDYHTSLTKRCRNIRHNFHDFTNVNMQEIQKAIYFRSDLCWLVTYQKSQHTIEMTAMIVEDLLQQQNGLLFGPSCRVLKLSKFKLAYRQFVTSNVHWKSSLSFLSNLKTRNMNRILTCMSDEFLQRVSIACYAERRISYIAKYGQTDGQNLSYDRFCPSVRPSVTRWYHAKTTPATIMRSSMEDSPMTLVSSRLTSPRNSKGNMGSEGAEWERGRKNGQFLANKSPYLRNGAR